MALFGLISTTSAIGHSNSSLEELERQEAEAAKNTDKNDLPIDPSVNVDTLSKIRKDMQDKLREAADDILKETE